MKTVFQNTTAARHPLFLTLLASLWLVTLPNIPLWRQLAQLPEVSGLRGGLFGLGLALGIAGLTHALLSLLNWRWLLKPVLTLFLMSAASGAYFMWSYGIVIDATMIVNVAQTDPREAADLLNWRLLLSLGVLGVLPVWWLWRQPVRQVGLLRRAGGNALSFIASIAVLALSLLLIYQDFASVMRNHTQLRYLINPLNSFYAVGRVVAQPLERDNGQVTPIGQDARLTLPAGTPPATLIVVVGETAARAISASTATNATPHLGWPAKTSSACATPGPAARALRLRCPACSRTWARTATKSAAVTSSRWWTCCSAQDLPCSGLTTSRAARACVHGCPTSIPRR